MGTNTAQKLPPVSSDQDSSSQNSIEIIKNRQSKELILAFCGPIGSGIKAIRLAFENNLENLGYKVHHIHISSLMDKVKKTSVNTDPYNRYIEKQNQGNALRENYGPQIMAEAAIASIAEIKQKSRTSINAEARFNEKFVYIIDQLKNPAEVELLRLVYQHNFYLIGVVRNESERKRNLRDEGISPQHIDELIHLDRKSGGSKGQQVEKTILDADFFIRNNQSHSTQLNNKVERFLGLIHGKNGLTPSLHEKGMFNAFSASLQSACLSRQVGAAIVDHEGNILSTGRNDVPRPGGGLYTFEDENKDFRCIHKGGKCYNDMHKAKIKDSITKQINLSLDNVLTQSSSKPLLEKAIRSIFVDTDFVEKLASNIYSNSPIKSLIEYSRAIHAEMDAITTLARTGEASTKNKIMFTTTYPCHNCARHIVAAGKVLLVFTI
ncbi:anti-phage dCTP deaminase [Salmonella enterica]|uniref:anti-phage dCTP deaminase n=1 Tax=Salmonella enterica TaxID=28901 RepID=UPI001CFBE33C|nr:anti-phage dCTP deaminase [Salmonella enterica]MCB4720275.1 cytidine deaminase [Salmonella enterica subsp. enterica serovar Mississippi]MCB4724513.1 cytidine deaminase [Salmonella enterica subsp. enterica serovar Mississippi]MCB4728720.1 cytidine deaminase [Salmonella enterica subsp. enterica serovar Mississippi]MCB4737418.1 cytidine deaminase [Salmonella enterica subsp. enterica serovar Mississippi]MCB4741858.1 cytidine deaminase [Salmonella enterica subsp. enterica serovar Mississippi]